MKRCGANCPGPNVGSGRRLPNPARANEEKCNISCFTGCFFLVFSRSPVATGAAAAAVTSPTAAAGSWPVAAGSPTISGPPPLVSAVSPAAAGGRTTVAAAAPLPAARRIYLAAATPPAATDRTFVAGRPPEHAICCCLGRNTTRRASLPAGRVRAPSLHATPYFSRRPCPQ